MRLSTIHPRPEIAPCGVDGRCSSASRDGPSGPGRSRRPWKALIAGLVAALVAVSFTPAPAADFDRQAVSAFIGDAFRNDRVPGGAVAIVRGGEIVLLEGFGHDAQGRPVTPDTGFRLGSMSKAFTALAVMRMVETSGLALDRPVRELMPEFRLSDMAAADAITLRHLLAHTSGIPERAPRAAPEAALSAHVAALAEVAPAAAPGARHIYASPNYLVAARLLEIASGRPFAAILREDVLAPLRMGCSHVSATEAAGGLSGGHQYWFGMPFPSQLPEEPGRLATASLISCARDMAQFVRFQLGDGSLDGHRLLSSDGMATMHEGTAQGDGFRYAMGWRDTLVRDTRAIEHGGILPDYRGKMILIPAEQAAVVVLTNASSGMPLPAAPTSHRVADSIAAYLAGGELKHPTLSFGVVSLAVATGLGLILLAATAGLVRVVTGRDRRSRPVLRAASEIAVVAALGLLLPVLLGLDWPLIFATMPDVALWMLALAIISVATAVARLVPRRPG